VSVCSTLLCFIRALHWVYVALPSIAWVPCIFVDVVGTCLTHATWWLEGVG
jgi:hypothetical protein